MYGLEIVVVVAMVLTNAVFAAYEIALASVSVSRLHVLINDNRSGARSALYMKEEIERSLAVVQLGITLVGLIAGATGGASAGDDLAPALAAWTGISLWLANVIAITLVVVPLTAVTIVIGELVPKLFALRHKEWVCLRLSPIMALVCASRMADRLDARIVGIANHGVGRANLASIAERFTDGSGRIAGVARDCQSGARFATDRGS